MYQGYDGLEVPLCERHYAKWKKYDYRTTSGRQMGKVHVVLAVLLVLSIASCFLPWVTANVAIDGEAWLTTNYGYQYIIPLGAQYTAPVATLSVFGFFLSVYSYRMKRRTRMLNLMAGVLILIGAVAAFAYTFSSAIAQATGSSTYSYSVSVWGEYGMGLEALLGFLVIIAGARTKPQTYLLRKG
jgi:hypothetical protein